MEKAAITGTLVLVRTEAEPTIPVTADPTLEAQTTIPRTTVSMTTDSQSTTATSPLSYISITMSMAVASSGPTTDDPEFLPELQNQPAGMVAIAAGAAGGGLVFMVLLIMLMAIVIVVLLQKYKWKTFNLGTNVAYYSNRRNTDLEKSDEAYDTIEGDFTILSTEQNVSYQPSAVSMSLNVAYSTRKGTEEFSQPTTAVELDMVYDIIEENTIEVQQSIANGEAFGPSTEQNASYQPSAVPTSLNVAYYSTRKVTEESSQPTAAGQETGGDNEYDYISTDQL